MRATERTTSLLLVLGLLGLAISGLLFYQSQNHSELPGGPVAGVKILWLGSVLFCWYWLPAVMLLEPRMKGSRRLLSIFLINMLLRAIIELLMMYQWQNWHPWYGISHDLFSALLCLLLAGKGKSRLIRQYFGVMAALFLVETAFAWYMLHHVQGSGPVYYVPPGREHQALLTATGLVVVSLWAWLAHLLLVTWKEE
ncbi:hypothetical protein [Thiolapillus brandeum]|uniref:Uncharacterized protein n=1 Tax=Thiolapillus brandeum TaxID=1076588 RepID=A0A7U6GGD0_9GAMM|nr:hypothetical protein [Thiolapillus brandeum]BAO43129.1 hypothetical protein TBH_C0181 [Thiolapillus brandeum]